MKKLFFAMSALAALSLLAPSSGVAQEPYNEIGIYTTTTPTPANDEASYYGALPGQFECYLVITNPFNTVTTMAPIVELGGFECHIALPLGFQIFSSTLPAGTINFTSPPTFFVSGSIPVTDNRSLLATLSIATFTGTDGLVYLEPVPSAPSIPGSIAITDAGDNFQLIEAFPSSDDLANPVFGINHDVIPSQDESWGDLKAMFR